LQFSILIFQCRPFLHLQVLRKPIEFDWQRSMISTSETGLSLSPYPGLRPFRRDEADIFFGREEQVDQLLGKLETCRFLAVVGVSGCGKSSLVRAGMLSALEGGFMASAGPRWHVVEMRPGGHPLAHLSRALLAGGLLGDNWRDRPDAEAFVCAVLRRGPLGLVELMRESPGDCGLSIADCGLDSSIGTVKS
jgi:Novel STAND NTPase 1